MWVLPSFCNHAHLSFLHLLSSILAGSHYCRQNPPAKNTKHYFFNLQNQKFLFLLLILMKLFFKFIFIILFLNHGISDSEIPVKYQLLLQVPLEYEVGFTGRAFLMETDQITPNFRVALSVEAINGKYSCSLEVFLGDVKVWNSGHYSRFSTTEKCMLELTEDGDLRLKGPKERVGWKTGTSGQAVERLQILRTGNLVLADALNNIKWQSFNFPTDVMLRGQRLNVATRLTSFRTNSSMFFYSFEIQNKGISLYLNSGELRYSYWEFKPSMNRSITFVKLGSRGLELFDTKYKKIAQIPSQGIHPLRFLALKNETGNFGIYYYSPEKNKFEASFQALNRTCDLPVACKPYGICTFSNTCLCIPPLTNENEGISDCSGEIFGDFCDGKQVEMLKLDSVSTLLKDVPKKINITRDMCENLCLQDCKCAAALYSGNKSTDLGECYIYRLVLGLRQVEKGVIDGLIILLVVGGLVYWFRKRNRSNTSHSEAGTS